MKKTKSIFTGIFLAATIFAFSILQNSANAFEYETAIPDAVAFKKAFDAENPIVDQADPAIWELLSDQDGVKSYRKKTAKDGLVAFRGEADLDTSVIRIASVFADHRLKKDWMDALVDSQLLFKKGLGYRVEYTQTHVPFPFKNRDFVYDVFVENQKSPAQLTLRLKEKVENIQPLPGGVLRGRLVYCFYHAREIEPGKKTRLIVEITADPMGSIPLWLANLKSKKWPLNTLSGIRKVATRSDLVIPEDVANVYK